MTTMICPQCAAQFETCASYVNRAAKNGVPLYCCRSCFSISRRSPPKSAEQKKAEKAAYDREYRTRMGEKLLAKKRAAYEANKPQRLAQMAEYRKIHMSKHVEYCRRPQYRIYKHQYDRKRNEAKYENWADAWRLLLDLEKEIRSQATAYERRVANGYYTRNAQKRRREVWMLRKNLNSTPVISSRNYGKL